MLAHSTYETILLEIKTGTGIITLNRPQTLNAINTQMIDTPHYKVFKEKIRTDGVKAAIAWREEQFHEKFGA